MVVLHLTRSPIAATAVGLVVGIRREEGLMGGVIGTLIALCASRILTYLARVGTRTREGMGAREGLAMRYGRACHARIALAICLLAVLER